MFKTENAYLQKRLIDARESSGLSQSEVARQLGVDNSVISRIESGDRKVSARELDDFSQLYQVSLAYLVGRSSRRHEPLLDNKQPVEKQSATDLNLFLEDCHKSTLTFKGTPLSDEQTIRLRIALTQIFWDELKPK